MGETDSAYAMLASLSVVISSQENSGRQCDRSAHKRLPVIRSDEQIRTQAIFLLNIFPFALFPSLPRLPPLVTLSFY